MMIKRWIVVWLMGLSFLSQAQNNIELDSCFKQHDFLILITLGPDCPISQKYMHTLRNMYSKYGDKIEFLGIVPSSFEALEMNEFKTQYAIPFDLKLDTNNSICKKFNLKVTPEIVLINKEREIHYQGAIDNWFYELGKSRLKVTEHYLEDAIESILKGNTPTIQKTEAIGCFISY